jgi:hypothetical protein
MISGFMIEDSDGLSSPLSNFSSQRGVALRRDHSRINLAIQKHSLPQFEIQKTPDTIAMVAMSGAVLIKNTLDRLAAEKATCLAARL